MSSRDGRGRGNPWNRGRGVAPPQGRQPQPRNNRSNRSQGRDDTSNAVSAAEDKFKKAKMEMQEAADKHKSAGYESSSEEEELESENILGSVLKSYASLGGTHEDLGRTQNFLEDAFQSGAAICLVCIATVKRSDAIWSCGSCWGFFHLTCVQRWAKDSVAHQRLAQDDRPTHLRALHITWACPKCRESYQQEDIPFRYFCFCGRAEDPVHHPWLVPHSCGETCNKPLSADCGHRCLLLCHPGPCPPCPKTVKTPCHCGRSEPRPQRCSRPQWSCGGPCSRPLGCGRHSCAVPCHAGPCAPCPRRSLQQCQCGSETVERECASPTWQCQRVCGKRFPCGAHVCERVCHSGACGDCPGSLPRTCPCGKTSYQLACTMDPPTCGDTCGRLLDCGVHECSQRCHRDKCGACLERMEKRCCCGLHTKEVTCQKEFLCETKCKRIKDCKRPPLQCKCLERVEKRCRCGLHTKEVPCQKEFLCETKCKRIKDCKRHPCNRKCCDGNCGPCEKPCGRTLRCGHHKCGSVCHRGQCYPCAVTVQVRCRCGSTAKTVPCGREKRTRPPRCLKPCRIPPDCHHPERDAHYCHFGSCPVCRQICDLPRDLCPHLCPKLCHSAVLVNVADNVRPAGPWEIVQPQLELRALPCGDCWEPVAVSCLGNHEVTNVPCYRAVPYPCGRSCGRQLPCGNHNCGAPCHRVDNAPGLQEAGSNCEPCASQCTLPRPEGCPHPCAAGCHPPPCAPCQALVRHRCHCAINQLFLRCGEWTAASDAERDAMLSCGNQCPKNYECGHRCSNNCHAGPCVDAELCRRKVKVSCPCRRIRRDVQCATVRAGQAVIECDGVCREREALELQKRLKEEEEKKRQEELRNKEELEKFEKKMSGKKKHRERRVVDDSPEASLLARYWPAVAAAVVVGVAVAVVAVLR